MFQAPAYRQPCNQGYRQSDIYVDVGSPKGQHLRYQTVDPELTQEQFAIPGY
jgi:hypothetical protein